MSHTLPLSAPSPLAPRLSDLALLLVAVVWGTSYGVAKGVWCSTRCWAFWPCASS